MQDFILSVPPSHSLAIWYSQVLTPFSRPVTVSVCGACHWLLSQCMSCCFIRDVHFFTPSTAPMKNRQVSAPNTEHFLCLSIFQTLQTIFTTQVVKSLIFYSFIICVRILCPHRTQYPWPSYLNLWVILCYKDNERTCYFPNDPRIDI